MRYATFALTAYTSRNWSAVSAPGTRPACQVTPPSTVRAHVAPCPLTQATRSETGLTAWGSAVVPLACSVRTGPDGAGPGDERGPQAAAIAQERATGNRLRENWLNADTITLLRVRSLFGMLAAARYRASPVSSPGFRSPAMSLFKQLTPVIIADAVEPGIAFWTDRLGFKIANQVPGPDGKLIFASAEKDGIEVMYQTRASVVADQP